MPTVTMRVMTPPTLLDGRYRLGDRLGAGAAGVVWRAWDVRLGRLVAIKQLPIPPGLAGEDSRRAHADAAREGRIAARLAHPAIAAVLDMVVEGGSSWLVMEYAPGLSLLAALRAGRRGPHEAARIGVALADALAEAHAAGVVHCDVKPANVLLGDHGRVKLADFGIARAVRGEVMTGPHVLSGTPMFMAPEVARGSWPGPASDVYSLGATLYAAVEGTGPCGSADHDDPLATITRVAEARVRAPRRAGPLTSVLAALLVADPAERPTAAQARDLLRAVASAGPTPSDPGRRPACTTRRRARALTALSTAGVVGVGALAGTVGGGGVLSMISGVGPPVDRVVTSDGESGPARGATLAPASRPDAAPPRPWPVPTVGEPIVVDDPPPSVSIVTAGEDGIDDDDADRPRVERSTPRATVSADPTPVQRERGPVARDVPVVGPVFDDGLPGVTGVVEDLVPVELSVDLPVDVPVDLPVGLPVELPVDLPVDVGPGDAAVDLPLDVDLPLGSGDEPVGVLLPEVGALSVLSFSGG